VPDPERIVAGFEDDLADQLAQGKRRSPAQSRPRR
jgi:hypothetical protein